MPLLRRYGSIAHRGRVLFERHRPLRFVLVGIGNTAFGYAIFAAIYGVTSWPTASLVLATIIGIIFNFFTTGRIVFNNDGLSAIIPFFLVYGVALIANVGLLKLMISLGIDPLVAQAVSLPAVVIISYTLNSLFVFRVPRVAQAPHQNINVVERAKK